MPCFIFSLHQQSIPQQLSGRGPPPNPNRSSRSAPNTPIKPRPATNPGRRPQSTTAARPQQQPNILKKDGEKGASAHTVSESHRIQLDALLLNLRESETETILTMPADLTNTQRKYVHELAKKLGLKSKSYGKGEARKVVVSKVDESKCVGIGSNEENIPVIDVGLKGEEVLKRYLKKFPPNEIELLESRETGSSLLKQRHHHDDEKESKEFDLLAEAIALLPPPPDAEEKNEAAAKERSAKQQQVIKRRVQNHAVAQRKMKSHPQYKKMMAQRKNLPAFEYAQDVSNILRDKRNQVIILTGDTGCG